jgi:hypothetical protein
MAGYLAGVATERARIERMAASERPVTAQALLSRAGWERRAVGEPVPLCAGLWYNRPSERKEGTMPEPVFVALLMADRVITEDNQKKGIIGTFTRFNVRQFPAILPPWFIYAAVTNLSGEHSFSVNLDSDSTQQVVFSAAGEINVDSQRRVVELVIQVGNAVFPQAGSYMVLFFIDGQQIGSRILEVLPVEQS